MLSKALAHLAELQRGRSSEKRQRENRIAAGVVIPDPRVEHLAIDRAEVEKFLADHARLRDAIPPTQSVADYLIMADLKAEFDRLIRTRFARRHAYNVSDKVQFGTVETHRLNGLIVPVPDSDEYLILLNRALWESLQILSYLIVSFLDFDRMPPALDERRAEGLVPHFAGLLTAVAMEKELPVFYTGHAPITDPRAIGLWNALHDAMNAFVFGHEYAHFLHGHIGDDGELEGERWSCEYEADRTGLDLLMFLFAERAQEATGIDVPERYLARNELMTVAIHGCVAFLHFVAQLESVQGIVYTADSTHPPAILRLASVMSVLGRQIGEPGTLSFLLSRLGEVEDGLTLLFDRASPSVAVPAVSLERRFERRFQDAVFGEIFRRTHHDVLTELYRAHDELAKGDEPLLRLGLVARQWTERARQGLGAAARDLSGAALAAMVERCIGVLERNADVWNMPRPAKR